MIETLLFTFEFVMLGPDARPPLVRVYVDVAGTVTTHDDVEVPLVQAGVSFNGSLALPPGTRRAGIWFQVKYSAPVDSTWRLAVTSNAVLGKPVACLEGSATVPTARFWAQLG
jgi:hypothetical protein